MVASITHRTDAVPKGAIIMGMFDEVQRGWLDGDDYVRAAEAAGVVELPDDGTLPPGPLPTQVSTGRWEDDNPPGVPR